MLVKDENLSFIQKKIREIKIAIFKAEMNSEIQLPNNIITTLKTDDEGNIWFFTSCYRNYGKNTDKHFYAYLEYFQKGSEYRLRISGKASVVEDDVALDHAPVKDSRSNKSEFLLIKLKIFHAEYFENRHSMGTSLTTKIKNFFNELFIPQHHRMFDFS